jgi:hypothetical protein
MCPHENQPISRVYEREDRLTRTWLGYLWSIPVLSLERRQRMSETVPNDRTDDVEDEVRETGDDLAGGADRAQDEAAEGADRVTDGVREVADRVSDTVEDMIPGDSDRDGH